MQVDGGPVGQLGIVDAHRAAPAGQIGQGAVGGLDLLVVGDSQLLFARPHPHPLGDEAGVFLGVEQPGLVFVFDLLLQVGHIGKGRVCHGPVGRVVHLVFVFQAADKRQKTAVLLAVEQDAAAPLQVVVQGAVAHLAVGSEDPHPRLGHLALTGDKDGDVVVVFKLVHLIEHHHARPHPVPALGVVGAALDDAFVGPALHQLFGVVVVFFQLAFKAGRFQHFGDVPHRGDGLFLVVGADVDVVMGHLVVG